MNNSYNQTDDWKLYEAGKQYNNSLNPNFYDVVDANTEFFSGNQWRNAKQSTLPRPVFNIIKRIVTYFVSSLCTAPAKVNIEPAMMTDSDPDEALVNAARMANKQIETLFDKWDMNGIVRDSYQDGAVEGDWAWHFLFDTKQRPYGGSFKNIQGEIVIEKVDGSNIMMGNANLGGCRNIERQPYIIIIGRDTVKNLKEEARLHQKDGGSEDIEKDSDYQYMTGDAGKIEVAGEDSAKALYIVVYRKDKDANVLMSKSVKNAYIFKNVNTELTVYPVVMDGWEHQKNQYHNRAVVTGMLPNQIFINQMMALVMQHQYMTGFPKAIYNGDVIDSFSNAVGEAIKVTGHGPDFNVRAAANYLQPGNMSAQIISVLELAMSWTKETLGVSDVAMGNTKLDNTSAIIAIQKSTNIPLETPKAHMYASLERAGEIILNMMGVYYGIRPVVSETDEVTSLVHFDFAQIKDLWLKCRADVGETSHWSELAIVQTMDGLFKAGIVDAIQYVERQPDAYIPQKEKLLQELRDAKQAIDMKAQTPDLPGQQTPMAAPEQSPSNDYEQMAAFFEALPPEVQAKLRALPDAQLEQEVMKLMQSQTAA